jgi:hypothetical protein
MMFGGMFKDYLSTEEISNYLNKFGYDNIEAKNNILRAYKSGDWK